MDKTQKLKQRICDKLNTAVSESRLKENRLTEHYVLGGIFLCFFLFCLFSSFLAAVLGEDEPSFLWGKIFPMSLFLIPAISSAVLFWQLDYYYNSPDDHGGRRHLFSFVFL